MSAARRETRLLAGFYAATALFLVLDVAAGINVRVAFLEDFPGWRAAYYLFLFACLGGMILLPAAGAVIGVVESAITLSALIISMMSRSMFIADLDANGEFDVVTIEEVVNFVISGSFAYYAFVTSMKRFRGI